MSNISYGKHGGYNVSGLRLLTTNSYKTVKSQKNGFLTGILYLAPHNRVGKIPATSFLAKIDSAVAKYNSLCPSASSSCIAACLYMSGSRIIFNQARIAPVIKAKRLVKDIDGFMLDVAHDIGKIARLAAKNGYEATIRLNGTSDLLWEKIPVADKANIFELFSDIQFYDYTKRYRRMASFMSGKLPPNYYLVFSHTEKNLANCKKVLARGFNVAVVFRKKLPASYLGYPVISGEIDDRRFSDIKPAIVGLLAKNYAKKDTSGFTVNGTEV